MSYKTNIRRMARQSGELPHEFLLRVSRGEVIDVQKRDPDDPTLFYTEQVVPDLAMRIDAAKASAPYFAPKLSIQQVDVSGMSELQDLSVDELNGRLRILLMQLAQVNPEAVLSLAPLLASSVGTTNAH